MIVVVVSFVCEPTWSISHPLGSVERVDTIATRADSRDDSDTTWAPPWPEPPLARRFLAGILIVVLNTFRRPQSIVGVPRRQWIHNDDL